MLKFVATVLSESIRDLIFALKKQWLLFTILFFLSTFTDQYFIWLEGEAGTDQTLRVMAVLGQAFMSLIYFLVFMQALPGWLYAQRRNQKEFKISKEIMEKSIPIITENLRAFMKILVGLLFFILPGLIRWIDYALVPYVVCLNPNYEKDPFDALKASKLLIKGFRWTFLIFLVIDTGLYFIFDGATRKWPIPQDPLLGALWELFNFTYTLWSYSFTFAIYWNLLKKQENHEATI
ncbi:MAG: hypothetical protein KDD61_02430 [Bdellovibrionales bacterium]|nr:hypothetical protein [Bdellovibrionales bacterium]